MKKEVKKQNKDSIEKGHKIYLLVKRILDVIMSGILLIILSPLMIFITILIKLTSRGPVFFSQKRVGIHKSHFAIHKFRTMKTSAPKDMPTHMLSNPDIHITSVGKILRKSSLDELPQLFDIFLGNGGMSFVGPRPALWNQADLIAEREKYGANDVPPGLTGWAQIHGRDELEIPVKARLDGYYVQHLGVIMDIICLIGTVRAVLKSDGIVEGGTGRLHEKSMEEDEL